MSKPRIAILGMHLESNAFAPATTGADFRASCYLVEDEIVAEAARPAPAMPAEIPGFVAEMDQAGAWEPVPIIVTATEPGGPVDHGFFTETMEAMRSRLARQMPLDAVYISNHGAMTSSGSLDADGELFRMVRDVVGQRTPVVATVDLHANISDEMAASTDAIIAYRTNPHVDQAERAAEAARLLRRLLDGDRLAASFVRLPIVAPTVTLAYRARAVRRPDRGRAGGHRRRSRRRLGGGRFRLFGYVEERSRDPRLRFRGPPGASDARPGTTGLGRPRAIPGPTDARVRGRRGGGSSRSRGRFLRLSTHRPVATSIRAARSRWIAAGTRSRCSGRLHRAGYRPAICNDAV